MRIAFIALKSSGSTFMDWSFNFLTNCNQGKSYSDKTKSWHPTVHDAVDSRTINAHGHPKNHPIWNDPEGNEIKSFLKDCKDLKGIITFYPIVSTLNADKHLVPYTDGRLHILNEGHSTADNLDPSIDGSNMRGDVYEMQKEMIQYLIDQNVKIFSIQPMVPYPYLTERGRWPNKQTLFNFFQRWLRTDSTSFKEIRAQISFRLLAHAKKTLEDIQQCHTQINTMVTDTFIDTHWQTNPEECMKKICDIVGLDIVPEKLIQWRSVAGRWIKNNENMQDWHQVKIKKINTAIVENRKMILPEMDILDQIIIMAHLMRDHGRRLMLPTDDFPLDTQILHGYLK